MKKLFLCFATIVVSKMVFAQDSSRVIINAVSQNEQTLTNKTYQYPQFVKGKAVFKNGSFTEAKLNYSYLSNKIVFIDNKGDTLELAQGENFSAVVIGADTFRYYKKEFLQQLSHHPTYNLFLKRSLRYNGSEKKGAYGTYSATTSVTSYTNIAPNEGGGYLKLTPDENRVYIFNDELFFAKNFDQLYPATKKGARELFAKNEKQLKDFLEQNPINFDKKEDLEKVLSYALTILK